MVCDKVRPKQILSLFPPLAVVPYLLMVFHDITEILLKVAFNTIKPNQIFLFLDHQIKNKRLLFRSTVLQLVSSHALEPQKKL
jgi:hypothetical protein